MNRSAFGVISLALFGLVMLVPREVRADTIALNASQGRSQGDQSFAAAVYSAGGAGSLVVTEGRGFATAPTSLVAGTQSLTGAAAIDSSLRRRRRPRASVNEPSTVLLMGLALLGAARFAQQARRTHQ